MIAIRAEEEDISFLVERDRSLRTEKKFFIILTREI